MRRLGLTAVLAVPFFLLTTNNTSANPTEYRGFGCGDFCFRLFPHIHQHGPLFNYGPYYGYYPFKPYGPWDAYLRYDPFFYGDPYAHWGTTSLNQAGGGQPKDNPNWYGKNHHIFHGLPVPTLPHLNLFHKHGCTNCGFGHASWLHGGWFRGHTWLHGSPLHGGSPALAPSGCSSCKAVAVTQQTQPSGDVTARYSGIGNPAQSAVYYPATPTLDPAVDVLQASGRR